MGVETYGFKEGEVKSRDFFVPCYLVVHPRGTLMSDVGVIPDSAFPAGGGPAVQGIMSSAKTLKSQLAQIGHQPSEITYLAMSHYHSDNVEDLPGGPFRTEVDLVPFKERTHRDTMRNTV